MLTHQKIQPRHAQLWESPPDAAENLPLAHLHELHPRRVIDLHDQTAAVDVTQPDVAGQITAEDLVPHLEDASLRCLGVESRTREDLVQQVTGSAHRSNVPALTVRCMVVAPA